jgi:prepilin peptidase dependent protein B
MISLALGMGVISAILLGYLATYRSSLQTLAASRLQQELGTLMELMVSELRRAGYSAGLTAGNAVTGNAFNVAGQTALGVFSSMSAAALQDGRGRGSCIVFAYDRDEDGLLAAEELSGFRLNGEALQIRLAGNPANPASCASTGSSWLELSDPGSISISLLDFDLAAAVCRKLREPDGQDNDGNGLVDDAQEADCHHWPPAVGSGELTLETRDIAVTLQGRLRADPAVSLQLQRRVLVRNDLLRLH